MNQCRYMFWVDWATHKIERASMDGSDRIVIISDNILNPVSLTLDYSSQTLYWIDDHQGIQSSSIDGTGRMLLFPSSNPIVYITYGMDYYSNHLYWTERAERAVYSAPTHNISSFSLLLSSLSWEPYQLHVVHPFSQPAEGRVLSASQFN